MEIKNFVVCGMGFGDEGKGSFIDFLAKKYQIPRFVRYNGGSQAAHSVITPENIKHTFSQIGSGALANGYSTTYLTKNMIVNLGNLTREIETLNKESIARPSLYNSVYIDMECLIVTPYHILINRMQELAFGKNSRGSIGAGVSTVRQLEEISNIKVRDVYNAALIRINFKTEIEYDVECKNDENTMHLDFLLRKLRRYAICFYEKHKDRILKSIEEASQLGIYAANQYEISIRKWLLKPIWEVRKDLIYDLLSVPNASYTEFLEDCIPYSAIYEGAQGLLIDKDVGTKPNTTYLDTTVRYAEEILNQKGLGYKKIGVIKAFYTRSGKGIFLTESADLRAKLNGTNDVDRHTNNFTRYGWFDAVMFNYANEVNKVDEVYLSSLDRFNNISRIKICNEYLYMGTIDDEFESIFDYYTEKNGRVIITRIKPSGVKSSNSDITKYMEKCMPRYIEVEGWLKEVESTIRETKTLPKEMLKYIDEIEKLINIPITVISLGPTRFDKVILK